MPQRPLRLNYSNITIPRLDSVDNKTYQYFFEMLLISSKHEKHPCQSMCHRTFHWQGACVYCRLLSVLLMQIIKFGGKLVVNPRCSSIERHDFKRSKANFYVLLLNRLHRGEQQHIADGGAVGEQHHQTVHAKPRPPVGGRPYSSAFT